MGVDQCLEQHCETCNVVIKVYPGRLQGFLNWERHLSGEKHQRKIAKSKSNFSSIGQPLVDGHLANTSSYGSPPIAAPPAPTTPTAPLPQIAESQLSKDSTQVSSADLDALTRMEQVLQDHASRLSAQDMQNAPACLGAPYSFSNTQNMYIDYPWALHAELSLEWQPEVINEHLYLRSLRCTRTAKLWATPVCDSCAHLLSHPIVIAIKARAMNGCSEKTNRSYYTIQQLHELLDYRVAQVKSLKVHSLNQGRAIASRASVLNDFNRFLMAVSSGKVERMSALVSVALRNGVGLSGIIERIERAMNHSYSPRSYGTLDYEKGILALRLGGAQLLNLLHRSSGFPHTRTIQRHTFVPRLQASSGIPMESEIRHNIAATSLFNLPKRIGATLMFDEIALKKALRFDIHHNRILGLCREHTSNHCSVDFTTYEDAEAILHVLQAGKIHMASEVSDHSFQPCSNLS